MQIQKKQKLLLIDDRLVQIDPQTIYSEFSKMENFSGELDSHSIEKVMESRTDIEDWRDIDWNKEKTNIEARAKEIKKQLTGLTELHYFGLTSIPSAFYLGTQLGSNLYTLQAHNRNHISHEWIPKCEEISPDFNITSMHDECAGSGDIVLIVETSYPVNRNAIKSIVPNPMNTISISLSSIDPDGIKSNKANQRLAQEFKETIDKIHALRPNFGSIHLFMAIPCGTSFLLGSKISPTFHGKIQTYHYVKESEYGYIPAILPNEAENFIPISESERSRISDLEKRFSSEFKDKILNFLIKLQTQPWTLLNGNSLPKISLAIKERFVDLYKEVDSTHIQSFQINFAENEDRFYDNEFKKWSIPYRLLVGLLRRGYSEDQIIRALRLFLFHEIFHFPQLPVDLSPGIGRFSEIISRLDRDADLFALLAEYEYTCIHHASNITTIKNFLNETIKLSIHSIWSFMPDPPIRSIEKRRMDRLLSSYAFLDLIKKSSDTPEEIFRCFTYDTIANISGPYPIIRRDRYVYSLKQLNDQIYIGMLRKGKFYYLAGNHNANGQALIEAISLKSIEDFEKVINQWYAPIR